MYKSSKMSGNLKHATYFPLPTSVINIFVLYVFSPVSTSLQLLLILAVISCHLLKLRPLIAFRTLMLNVNLFIGTLPMAQLLTTCMMLQGCPWLLLLRFVHTLLLRGTDLMLCLEPKVLTCIICRYLEISKPPTKTASKCSIL